ncbi:MAG: aldo/keto reductase [Armatimonadota bacterium]
MEYLPLVSGGPKVSRVAFGCEPLGGTDWGTVDDDLTIAAVHRALDMGVNFFDTADVYGLGRSEKMLAKALGSRRDQVVIASKFGCAWDEQSSGLRARVHIDCSPTRLEVAIKGSLSRLGVDHIDLYYIHKPDLNTPLEATLEAMVRLRESGVIGHIGVSNFSAQMVREANAITPIAAVQLHYSIVHRSVEVNLLDTCRELGIGVVAYGALAQGLLTGKFDKNARFATSDRRHRLPHFQGEALRRNLRTVERIRDFGASLGKTPSQVAARWVLDHPAVSCAVVGAKSPKQLEENVGVCGWMLTELQRLALASE